MFLHPNSAPLWKEYLLFTQSYFSSFTVSKVNAAYGKCLSTLSAVRDGSMVSHPALPGAEEDMLGNKSFLVPTLLVFRYEGWWGSSPSSATFAWWHFYVYTPYLLKCSFCPDIFTQQCHFLRQSGHSEKAISLFQAMIDFTFFKPESVKELSTKQQVNQNIHIVAQYRLHRY